MKTIAAFTMGLVISTAAIAVISASYHDVPSPEQQTEMVLNVIKSNPGVVYSAITQHLQAEQEAEARSADEQTLSHKAELTQSEGYPFIGNQNGQVEISYYFDGNCHYCKLVEPDIERFIADNADVKFIHRELPILSESSKYAAIISGLISHYMQPSYHAFHQQIMAEKPGFQAATVERILRDVTGENVAGRLISIAAGEIEDPQLERVKANIEANLKLAQKAGINGTPFIIGNGSNHMVRGAAPSTYDELSKIAEEIRASLHK